MSQKEIDRLTKAYDELRVICNKSTYEKERLTAEVEAARRLLEQTIEEKRVLVQNNKAITAALTNAQHMIAVVVNPQLISAAVNQERAP